MDRTLRLTTDTLLHQQKSASHWWYENTIAPAVHTALGEPYNALARGVNEAARFVAPTKAKDGLLPELAEEQPQAVPLWSKEWYARNISSGLAMALPYGVAAALTGRGLHRLGAAIEAKGITATALKSREVAMVLGAFCYDGLKVPHKGETRFGNACGGGVGFAIFEAGNHPIKKWSIGYQIPARMLVGMAGALGHHSVAHLVSGQEIKRDQLYEVAMSGATMNVVLPYTHKLAERGVDTLSQSLGLGSPLELRLRLKYGERALQEDLPLLQALVARNPWARIQEGASRSEANSRENSVRLAAGEATPERCGHELAHLLSQRSGQMEQKFGEAAAALETDAARAWNIYRETRLSQELDACVVEYAIGKQRAERNSAITAEELGHVRESLHERIPELKATESATYEQVWRAEFDGKFKPSGGKFRPVHDYGADWHRVWFSYESMYHHEKVELARTLPKYPPEKVLSLWQSLFDDPDGRIRVLAVEHIRDLPAEYRLEAWRKAVDHSDYQTRTAAISLMNTLPETGLPERSYDPFTSWSFGERLRATVLKTKDKSTDLQVYLNSVQDSGRFSRAAIAEFTASPRAQAMFEVLLNRSVLELPVDPELAQRYGGREHCARTEATLPADGSAHRRTIPEPPIGEQIVQQIVCLPVDLQPIVWRLALENPATAPHAVRAISMLPADARYDAWCYALDVEVKKLSYSRGEVDEPKIRRTVEELLDQVDCLPVGKQQEARENAAGWRDSLSDGARKAQTSGRARPPAEPVDWAEVVRNYSELSETRKLELASGLQFAPDTKAFTLWNKLILDPNARIRFAAVENMSTLPAHSLRMAWQQAINHSDYHTRVLAISQIAQLPASQRAQAWSYVLNQPRVLAQPLRQAGEPAGEGSSSSSRERAVPEIPEGLPRTTVGALRQGAEALLIEQIAFLPGIKAKERAWKAAAGDERTRIVALSNFAVLPQDSRAGIWQAEWNGAEGRRLQCAAAERYLDDLRQKVAEPAKVETELDGHDRSKAGRSRVAEPPSEHELLLEQIPTLTPAQRLRAWDRFIESVASNSVEARQPNIVELAEICTALPAYLRWRIHNKFFDQMKQGLTISEDSIRRALTSLPEDIALQPRSRTGEWYRLLDALIKSQADGERTLESLSATRVGTNTVKDIFGSAALERWLQRSRTRLSIGAALEALPEHARMDAWYTALGELGKSSYDSLGRTVRLLPAGDRVRAFRHLAGEPDCYELRQALPEAVSGLPSNRLPEIARIILSLPDADVRNSCLRRLPVYDVVPWNAEEATRILREFFEVLKEHEREVPAETLQSIWQELDYFEHDAVRAKLAQELPPEFLCRLFFAGEGIAVGESLAKQHPEVIRRLSLTSTTDRWESSGKEPEVMALAANVWLGTNDLNATANVVLAGLKKQVDPGHLTDRSPTLQLVVELSKLAAPEENAQLLRDLARKVMDKHPSPPDAQVLQLGCKIAGNSPDLARANFLEPLEAAIADHSKSYMWRLNTARELGRLSREGVLPEAVRIPDMRMRGLDLPQAERDRLAATVEDALHNPHRIAELLADGELGRLFPHIFGRYEQHGGIVGRPQHGGHEFPIDVHTVLVVERVRNHPDFASLTPKDQMNVLWAAFLHDVGKKASVSDPGHEWVSANLGWGVLETLGYPTERIQRIANLVSRHVDMSFSPHKPHSQLFAEQPQKAVELAVFYRHPSAIQQLLILNEADIRSIDSQSKYWTPAVREELSKVSAMVAKQRQMLDQCTVPVLTTQLPRRFGLFTLADNYAVLSHQTDHLARAFIDQLALIESTEYSMSGSLLTHDYKQVRSADGQLVVLVSGPSEHVAQLGRQNLGTGCNVNWLGHVSLAEKGPKKMADFIRELDGRLAAQAQSTPGAPPNLRALWRATSQYDNLTELLSRGSSDPVVSAYYRVVTAMTRTRTDGVLKEHNEVKMINARVTGIGLLRAGRPVFFEGLTVEQARQMFANDGALPAWLATALKPPERSLIVPRSVWQAARERGWPIVSLE